jgi:phage N-6-adenine-methyltransferase
MKPFIYKSNTAEPAKDLWQTPKALFNALNDEFWFTLDACASSDNTLCYDFLSEEKSALEHDWLSCEQSNTGAVFINPPYSQAEVFLKRASHQAQRHNLTVVALVNANTDTKWFAEAVSTANEVRLITGRISFVKPDGSTGSAQNTKGQCLIIWRGRCSTPCQFSMIDRVR